MTGFANVRSAFIVIGVRTARHENEVVEAATTISPVSKPSIDAGRHRDVIEGWVFPPVRNLKFKWYPPEPSANEGLFVIEIGEQRQADRYFLVKHLVNDEGVQVPGTVVPIREGDRTRPLSPEDIHRLIRDGLRAQRLPANIPEDQRPSPERVEERIRTLEELQEWSDKPVLFLAALPLGTDLQLPNFFAEAGVWGLLSDPPSLRQSGFNLRTWRPAAVLGDSLVASRSEDVALLLDADGLFLAGAGGHRDFLGWSINDRSPDDHTWINPIVLVEFVLEFFRFVHNHIQPQLPQAGWRFRIECKRFNKGRLLLAPGRLQGRPSRQLENVEARSDDWTREFAGDGSPGADAYQALSNIYALFNLPSESIPYATGTAISEDIVSSL